ncbi:MAG: hypothetical protein ABC595_07165 [Candidatus Methanosuratincola petrocarbonis]
MKKALKTEYWRIYTSDYVIDEAITTALVRTRRHISPWMLGITLSAHRG